MKLSVGIIGCGGIAKRHIAGYRENGINVVALTDTSAPAAAALAGEVPEAQIFASAAELLASGAVNAVSICTPPDSHEAIAADALTRGIHVLCEKPVAHTLAAAEHIAAAAKDSPAVFMVAFRHRFLPAVTRLRQLIAEGAIGRPVLMQNIFCGPAFGMKDRWFARKAIAGGGTLIDTTIHSVDIFRFLFGEVTSASALTTSRLEGIDVEDSSTLIVKSASGVLGSLSASWVSGEGVATIEVIGEGGRITFDYTAPDTLTLRQTAKNQPQQLSVPPSSGFAEQIAAFAAAIASGGPSPCPVTDGLRALQIVSVGYNSSEITART